jgi:Rrf2 family nitric oxide-sensitive transcriptional repressor
MKLTFSTDCALRVLILVGLEPERLVAIVEGRGSLRKYQKNHLMKVTHQLGQAGYLETVRGRNGGLRLGKPPDQIVVGEVVRKMEPDFAVVEFSLNKEETTMANYDYLIIGGGMTSAVDGIREVDPTAQVRIGKRPN